MGLGMTRVLYSVSGIPLGCTSVIEGYPCVTSMQPRSSKLWEVGKDEASLGSRAKRRNIRCSLCAELRGGPLRAMQPPRLTAKRYVCSASIV